MINSRVLLIQTGNNQKSKLSASHLGDFIVKNGVDTLQLIQSIKSIFVVKDLVNILQLVQKLSQKFYG